MQQDLDPRAFEGPWWPSSDRPPQGLDPDRSMGAVRFEPVDGFPVEGGGLQRWLRALQEVRPAGGALAAAFDLEDLDDGGRWLLRHPDLPSSLRDRLLADAGVRSIVGAGGGPGHGAPRFTPLDALLLAGDLAVVLVGGGAHDGFAAPHAVARDLAAAAVEEVLGDRYEQTAVVTSSDAWTDWFGAVAWDRTWIVTDVLRARVTLIATTDTD